MLYIRVTRDVFPGRVTWRQAVPMGLIKQRPLI